MSTDWKIYTYEQTSGAASGSWVESTSALKRPNATLSTDAVSTLTELVLANGEKAYISPEVSQMYGPVSFVWSNDDGTLKDLFESYQKEKSKIKITTHLTGTSFIGYLTNVNADWLAGILTPEGDDMYDVSITMSISETNTPT